jgi:hypothetical protein
MDIVILIARKLGLPSLLRSLGLGRIVGTLNTWNLHRIRAKVAHCHLHGIGLEIGALHFPLGLPPAAKAIYLDRASREDNIRHYTDVNQAHIVRTDVIANGFNLACFGPETLDFIIANHVLEHTDDALGALSAWAYRIRAGGHLFITLPIANKCFDRGRSPTTLQHLIDDRRLKQDEKSQAMADRNLEHYQDWVCISEANINESTLSESETERRWRSLAEQEAEIHFHAFSPESLAGLMKYFCTDVCPDFRLLEIRESGGEVISLLQRSETTGYQTFR